MGDFILSDGGDLAITAVAAVDQPGLGELELSGGGQMDAAADVTYTTDLGVSIDSLRNVVARPGTFSDFFPETTEDGLLSVLIDGFAEAQLEGLLLDFTVTDDGNITPEISRGQMALVVLFAGVRFLRAELINRNTQVVYKAGSAHYETTQATNILRDILKGLLSQRDRVVAAVLAGSTSTGFYMADQYLVRVSYPWDYLPAAGW